MGGEQGPSSSELTDHNSNSLPTPWAGFEELRARVLKGGASVLQGSQVGARYIEKLGELEEAGLFDSQSVNYLRESVTWGFDMDLDEEQLRGRRVFKNYPTAEAEKDKVTAALKGRVDTGKTLKVCAFAGDAKDLPFDNATVVPMGSVAKKLEPDKVRPYSDHTKTLFNKASRTRINHTLDTYEEIARELKPGYFARIEDVDAAFPVLPLHPRMWNYMFVWWYDVDVPLSEQTGPNTLYCHVFADFGTAPLPGIWDLFWKSIKAMAEMDGVLNLPMPHYVDDNTLIGPSAETVDAVGEQLSDYVEELGVPFKRLKTRRAAMLQLVLGFWWDSVLRTRTLETEKLAVYVDHLLDSARANYLTLADMRTLLGRMIRASMTMPQGSKAFIGELLRLMRGLKCPHHRRRLTRAARQDFVRLASILRSNHGQGYFDTSHLPWFPAIWTDAMQTQRQAAWGWCCANGEYDYGVYDRSDRKKVIDALEGDAVFRAIDSIGAKMANHRVPVYIDNSAFQLSFKKGWSRADRLTEIIKLLYEKSVEFNCVLVPIWISTHDNIGADALSRMDFDRFHAWATEHIANDTRRWTPTSS